MSRSAIAVITKFDGKCHNLQMSPVHVCASSYHFKDIQIFNHQKVDQGHGVQF